MLRMDNVNSNHVCNALSPNPRRSFMRGMAKRGAPSGDDALPSETEPKRTRLRTFRDKMQLSAEKVGLEMGLNGSTVTRNESEPWRMKLGRLYHYAAFYGVKPAELLSESPGADVNYDVVRMVVTHALARIDPKRELTADQFADILIHLCTRLEKTPAAERQAALENVFEDLVAYATAYGRR